MEDQIWSARTKQYLEESKSLKVEVEELESLLGPEDSDVDFRRILEEARNKEGCAIFETFGSDGVLGCKWNAMGRAPKRAECAEELRSVQLTWQHNSSSSTSGRQWEADLEEQRVAWSSSERKVMAAVEDYLENCAGVKAERLMAPEEVEVCLRYILAHARGRGSRIF